MKNNRCTGIVVVAAMILLQAVLSCAAEQSIYETILLEKNIQPTRSALSKYLRELHPDAKQLDRVKKLIQQLGINDSLHPARRIHLGGRVRHGALCDLLANEAG